MKRGKYYMFLILVSGISFNLNAQGWTLDSCLNYAMLHNKSLLASVQSGQSSELDMKSSKSGLLPEINLDAGMDYYWKIPVQAFPGELVGQPEGTFVPVAMGTPWMGNLGLNASVPLIDPARWQEIKLSTLQLQSAQSGISSARRLLSRNVEMAFFQAIQEQRNLNLAIRRLGEYQETHDLINRRFEKGLIDKISLNQSASLLKDRENDRNKAVQAVEIALLDLKYWMGHPMKAPIELATTGNSLDATYVDYDSTALPDYNSEKLKVDLAEQQLKSSRANYYPHISFNGGFTRMGFGETLRNTDWFSSGFVGLRLNFPLFSLSKMSYAPQKHKSDLAVANLRFENYLEEQKRNYLSVSVQSERARESVKIAIENVKLAEENKKLATRKIEKGIIDMIELKQIEQDLTSALEQLQYAELDLLKYTVELNYLQSDQVQP